MTVRQWFCVVNGNRHGPVGEEVLRQWIAEGHIGPSDLVWSEPMTEWLAAGAVLSDAFAGGQIPVLSLDRSIYGTGGTLQPEQITAKARQTLQGHWGLPIGFCLLLWLLSTAISSVPFLGRLASGGPFELGRCLFFLALTRQGKPELGMMFGGFKNFWNALATYLLRALFIILWVLPLIISIALLVAAQNQPRYLPFLILCTSPLIVPAMIVALGYSQAMYLVADEPGLRAMEALRRSKALMQGHKARLFLLLLRYILWSLACILTFGIGFLWLVPYANTGMAIFYNDLQQPVDRPVNADQINPPLAVM